MSASSSFHFLPHELHHPYQPSLSVGLFPPAAHSAQTPRAHPDSTFFFGAGHGSSFGAPYAYHTQRQGALDTHAHFAASWNSGGSGELELDLDQAHLPSASPSPTSSSSSSSPPPFLDERPSTPFPAQIGHDVLAPPPSYGGRPRGRILASFPSGRERSAAAAVTRSETPIEPVQIQKSGPSGIRTRPRSWTTSSAQTQADRSRSSDSLPSPPPAPPVNKRTRPTRSAAAPSSRRRFSPDEDEEEREEEDEEGDDDDPEAGEDKLFTTHDEPGYSWGLPRAEYLALSASAKKQLRNRVGAKIFRERRKNYLHELEGKLKVKDERIRALENEVAKLRSRGG